MKPQLFDGLGAGGRHVQRICRAWSSRFCASLKDTAGAGNVVRPHASRRNRPDRPSDRSS